MDMLKGKSALITGASRGIGAAIARKFASEGANLIISATNEELLNKMKKELGDDGCDVEMMKCDVSDAESFKSLVQFTIDTFGTVDILVNNAGIARDGLIMVMKEDDWDDVININLKGTFNGIKSVTRSMLKAKSGCIINITSVVGLSGNAGQANYAASKAGIIGLTKSVAKELGSRNIRVNAIAPGFIETEMTGSVKEDAREKFLKDVPLVRTGTGEDVANLALFLASDSSSYITGQVINVDGGLLM